MALLVQTLSEQIFTLLRDRIISGKIPVDAAIRQDALAAELGVSKIPLREALARLEQDGLLLSHANRGFFVRPLSYDEVDEVYALRLKLEPDAVGRAARLADDADRLAAQNALVALDDAAATNRSEIGKLNRAFHMALVNPLRRPVTIQIIERLHIISERYVGKHLEPAGRDDRAQKEHTGMYQLWAAGKSDEVAHKMSEHIATTRDDLRRQLEAERLSA